MKCAIRMLVLCVLFTAGGMTLDEVLHVESHAGYALFGFVMGMMVRL